MVESIVARQLAHPLFLTRNHKQLVNPALSRRRKPRPAKPPRADPKLKIDAVRNCSTEKMEGSDGKVDPGARVAPVNYFFETKCETKCGKIKWLVEQACPKCLWCGSHSFPSETKLLRHLRNAHPKFDFRLEYDCGVPRIIVSLAGSTEQAISSNPWWEMEFVRMFARDEQLEAIRMQAAMQQRQAEKNLQEANAAAAVAAAAKAKTAKQNGAAKRDCAVKENAEKQHVDDEEDTETAKRKAKRRKRKLVGITSAQDLLSMTHHSTNMQLIGEEDFEVDSEQDFDEDWIHETNEKLLAGFTDVVESEQHFMSIWNRFITSKPAFQDDDLPKFLLLFVQECWQTVLDNQLQREFTRHTLNLFEFCVIRQQVVLDVNMALAEKAKSYIRRTSSADESGNSPVRSPNRSPCKRRKVTRRSPSTKAKKNFEL